MADSAKSSQESPSASSDPSTTPAQSQLPAASDAALTKTAAKNAAKRAEKAAKFASKVSAKTAQDSAAAPAAPSDASAKKEKKKPVETEAKQDPPYIPFVNKTPKGQKKDLTEPMAAGYDPIAVESAWYEWWNSQGFFSPALQPDGSHKPQGTFTLPCPPPNVTGSLHIGHGLTLAIQDALVRWNRMLGKTVLFLPGFDHAGISTQSVVEKRMWKLEKKTRHDLGRQKFVEQVMVWKEDYQERITNQMKRLGGSYDWDRVAFTMNESLSSAVVEAFCRLHEEGIIYRANRLVNWCVQLQTTISNLEVDQKQLTGRTMLNVPGYDPKEKFEFGAITSFAYPIEGSDLFTAPWSSLDERIIVATTRPETMLGDTAIAVHPSDPRYTHLHGKFATHPFVPARKIPVVADAIVVDMAFGTGAVKITPAHDPADYACGVRNKLEFLGIMNDDGTLNENAGEKFKGMKRFHARVAVIDALKELGLYIETKDNAMNVPVCSKSGDIIEPVMKPQWWVKSKPLADAAIERTRAGELRITPKQSESEWYRWMEDIQDWCISRQLWWGHRCPAYLIRLEGVELDANDGANWVTGRTLAEAQEKANKLDFVQGKKFTLEQDPDVLDTWFSSGLWPFSTLGWPQKTPDMAAFYPTTLLETGWDILFFWVARMVMLGIKFTDEVPFNEVLCHAMVRDAHGRKMSKSLGNVIDPIDVIEGITLDNLHAKLLEGNLDDKEVLKAKQGQKKDFPKGIPQCGTDALRFALCAYTAGGRDINLEILRVEGYRKFCNKIWNATKFAMLKLDESFVPEISEKPTGKESLVEKWIMHKLNIAATEVNTSLAERNFMAATTAVYNFWLYELCDVYIEAMKPMTDEGASTEVRKSAQNTLYTCLDSGLKLLHPFMPFVTEELWQRLPRRPQDKCPSIMMATYPVQDKDLDSPDAEKAFDVVFSIIKATRSLAAQYNLGFNVQLHIQTTPAEAQLMTSQIPTIITLTKGCKEAAVVTDIEDVPLGCGSFVVNADVSVHVLVKGMVDLDDEIRKIQKKLDLVRLSSEKLQKTMSQGNYEEVIPGNVRLANAEKMRTLDAEVVTLTQSQLMFAKLK
ncbi:hypothetical protein FRB98_000680 [Tulasnella sp. 332]|nr:hypothetical protein FRB98_000680 [Tulasnella sp. 332]